MKKAKLMLSAIAVFAIVGSVLALKAKNAITIYTQTAKVGGGTTCAALADATVTSVSNTTFVGWNESVVSATTDPAALCTSTLYYETVDSE